MYSDHFPYKKVTMPHQAKKNTGCTQKGNISLTFYDTFE